MQRGDPQLEPRWSQGTEVKSGQSLEGQVNQGKKPGPLAQWDPSITWELVKNVEAQNPRPFLQTLELESASYQPPQVIPVHRKVQEALTLTFFGAVRTRIIPFHIPALRK